MVPTKGAFPQEISEHWYSSELPGGICRRDSLGNKSPLKDGTFILPLQSCPFSSSPTASPLWALDLES